MPASLQRAAHRQSPDDRPRPKRKRRTGTYALIEFLRPDAFWPSPYSLEQAFGVLQAMVRTGDAYSYETGWGPEQVIDVMSNMGGGINRSSMSPVSSLRDLRDRFHYALLARGNPAVQQWRRDHGFESFGTVTLDFPHWKPFAGTPYPEFASEAAIADALKAMLTPPRGTKLVACPNAIHFRALEAYGVRIHILPEAFVFNLSYGYDGSSWSDRLAHTRKCESFLDTAVRAWRAYRLLTGKPRADLAARLNELVEPEYDGTRPF